MSRPEKFLLLRRVNKIQGDTFMNYVKKIGLLFLVLGVITGFTQAAKKEKPDATMRISGKSVAAGIGFSWGKATLTYKGKDYPVSVNGLSLGKVGISSASAYGEVYNLKKLQDFNGHYHAGGAGRRGVTLASGQSASAMTNSAGVTVLLSSTQKGVDVNVGGGGVDMAIKK
jgi:energy-coupling factor transporter transmembrane protein EcfT